MSARAVKAALFDFDGTLADSFAFFLRVFNELDEEGVALAVVSSNSRDNVMHVLGESARAVRYFECGASIFGKRARLRKVLRKSGVSRESVIYVGDQATDLEAARAEGVAFGAVAWGYGDIDGLRALRPDQEFHRVPDLLRIAA